MKLIEGQVVTEDDAKDQRIEELEDEIRVLKAENLKATRDAARSVAGLRRQLTPLYQALQAVFGELDAIHDDSPQPAQVAPGAPQDARVTAVWAAWKSRLGKGPGAVIDALQLHGDMNTQQLSIATGYHRNNIPGHIHQLNKAGLINKNGGRFSLKSL